MFQGDPEAPSSKRKFTCTLSTKEIIIKHLILGNISGLCEVLAKDLEMIVSDTNSEKLKDICKDCWK